MLRIFRSVRDKLKPSLSIRGMKSKPALFAISSLAVGGSILCYKKMAAGEKKLLQKPTLTINQTKLDFSFQDMSSHLKEVLKEYNFDEKQQKGFLLFCLTQYDIDLSNIKFSDQHSANEWLLSLACSAEKACLNTRAYLRYFPVKNPYTGEENKLLALKSAELLGMLNVVKADHNDQLPFDAIVFDTAWNWGLMEDIAESVRLGRTPDTVYCVAPEAEKDNKYIEVDLSWKKAIALNNRNDYKNVAQINPHTKVDRIFYNDSNETTKGRVTKIAEAIANHPTLSKKKVVIYMWSSDAIWQFEIIKNALKKANPGLKVCLNANNNRETYPSDYSRKLSDMITEKYPAIKEKIQKQGSEVTIPKTTLALGKPIGKLC